MPVLIKNQNGITPECSVDNKINIEASVLDQSPDLDLIGQSFSNYKARIEASSDHIIRNFARATSFRIEDILLLIQNSPNAKYLRVYNGLDDSGRFETYVAPITNDFNTLINEANSVICMSCCHCSPCVSDNFLNRE